MNSILRWAGSKRRLLHELRGLTPSSFQQYIEPFAGSAVLFFDLLPSRAILGDLNPEVIATYSAIRDNPRAVSQHLQSIPRTRDAYYKLRAIEPTALTPVQRAARLIFLMKGCFNGVYRTNRRGAFNVPIGNKIFALPDVETIDDASRALSNTDLLCGDFEHATSRAVSGDFVYLDPPYSDGVRFRGEYSYQGAFQSTDLERLLKACTEMTSRNVRVLLSFKDSQNVMSALDGWSFKQLDVARSVSGFAHARRTAREILAYNYSAVNNARP